VYTVEFASLSSGEEKEAVRRTALTHSGIQNFCQDLTITWCWYGVIISEVWLCAELADDGGGLEFWDLGGHDGGGTSLVGLHRACGER
jgi:hypothetical protein